MHILLVEDDIDPGRSLVKALGVGDIGFRKSEDVKANLPILWPFTFQVARNQVGQGSC